MERNEVGQTGLYRFGAYELNTGLRELRLEGSEVRLQPRVFDLLVYLIEHRDRAVNKDELQDAVWPGMYITETALTRAVMKARKAVGDDANTQAVIKTLHGHGYRFVAELLAKEEPVSGSADPDVRAPEPAASAAAVAGGRKSVAGWIVAAGLAVALAVGWYITGPSPGTAVETRIAVMPLLNATGDPELDWTRLGLMSFVSGMIDTDGQLGVVPDADVLKLADSEGWDGRLEPGANPELVGKLRAIYGATHVLAMHLSGSGDSLRMNYGLLQPGGELTQGTMVGEKGTGLAQGVVQSIYGELLGRMRPAANVEVVSDDPFINEAFARGMGLSLEGRCEDANQLFRVITDQEPGLFLPRYELARCLRILGDWQAAESLLEECIAEQREKGNNRYLGLSLMVMGVLYNRIGRLEEADAHYRQALEVARAIGDHELRAEVLNQMAIMADDRSEFDLANDLINRSMLAYQESGRELVPGGLWSARANLNMSRGNLAQADEDLARALDAYRQVGDRRREAMMINNTGFLRRLQGRLDEAETFHLRSLAIREEIGDRVGVGRIHNFLAIIHTTRGEFDKARESTLSALEISRETRDRLFEATALTRLADIEVLQEELEGAEQHFLEAREIFAEIEDLMRVLQVDVRLAKLELARENFDAAEEMAAGALQRARAEEIMQAEVEAMELMADVAVTRQDFPIAVSRYGETLDRVRQTSWTSKEATILQKLATTFMDVSDLDSAEPLVGALTLMEPSKPSLLVQARFESMRGNFPDAVSLAETAKENAANTWDEEDEAVLARYAEAAGLLAETDVE